MATRQTNNHYKNIEDENNTLINGYMKRSVEQFITVPSDVICFACKHVMQEPIKTDDGASYCKTCYISKKEFTSRDKMPNFVKSEELEKKIASLQCYCNYRVHGCGWKGENGQLDHHLTQCDYLQIQCQYCGMLYGKQFENTHKGHCSHVKCACGYVCHKSVINEHRRVCNSYITCAKCTFSVMQQDFQNHIRSCKQMYCGACKDFINEEKMFTHVKDLETNTGKRVEHVQLMIDEVKLAQNMVNSCKLDIKLLEGEIYAVRSQFEEHAGVGAGRKDGTLIWIVDDVLNRLNTAKYNNQAIYSPHFYTHENGYKMGAKLFLNGDCEANGSYISLYFLLYKGPFDDILPWPFSPRVSLQILGGGKKNIEKTFTPEKTSLSFIQPQEFSNIPSGYKRFAPQDILNQDVFVRGRNLFIKVITESGSIRYP